MKVRTALSVVAIVLCAGVAFAQDPVTVDPAHYSIVLDNPTVRVLKISYKPGDKSVMHQHPDGFVVPLSTSTVRFHLPDGKSEQMDLPEGSAAVAAATTHAPENVGKGPVDALLVEFKRAPGTATLPSSRGGMAMKVLAESPRGMVYRSTADPAFHEPAGTTHEFDQVVISLDPAGMALTIEGQPPKTTWARGDATFIGRGVKHESKNTGGKPVDFVIVAIK